MEPKIVPFKTYLKNQNTFKIVYDANQPFFKKEVMAKMQNDHSLSQTKTIGFSEMVRIKYK